MVEWTVACSCICTECSWRSLRSLKWTVAVPTH